MRVDLNRQRRGSCDSPLAESRVGSRRLQRELEESFLAMNRNARQLKSVARAGGHAAQRRDRGSITRFTHQLNRDIVVFAEGIAEVIDRCAAGEVAKLRATRR